MKNAIILKSASASLVRCAAMSAPVLNGPYLRCTADRRDH
jgi:hypothetical protein